jgi:hypothetical protein
MPSVSVRLSLPSSRVALPRTRAAPPARRAAHAAGRRTSPVTVCKRHIQLQQRIRGTDFSRAERVMCVCAARDTSRRTSLLRLHVADADIISERGSVGSWDVLDVCAAFSPDGRYISRQYGFITHEHAIIVAAATVRGASALHVKLPCTGEDVIVDAASLRKLRQRFAPGDDVRRAMLDGNEEHARVRGAADDAAS